MSMGRQEKEGDLDKLAANLLNTFDESAFFKQLEQYVKSNFPQDQVVIQQLSPCETYDGIIGHVQKTRKSYFSNNLKRDPLFLSTAYEKSVTAELCVPILADQNTLGTIHLRSSDLKRNYSIHESEMLNNLLAKVQRPLSNIQMYLSAKYLNEVLLKKIEEKENEKVQRNRQGPLWYLKTLVSNVEMVGNSPNFHNILQVIEKVARTDSSVFITGENGIGKELLGRRIHQLSSRSSESYIIVNALSLNELEYEGNCPLRDIFLEAKGGTVFFKNLSDLKSEWQQRLLTILQEKEILQSQQRIGMTSFPRLIFSVKSDEPTESSKAEMPESSQSNKFLTELSMRVKSIHLKIPSLTHRKEDIPLLFDFYLNSYGPQGQNLEVSPEAMKILVGYNWPGNIRELQNVVINTKILASGRIIRPEHLPEELRKGEDKAQEYKFTEQMTLESLERAHICKTLERLLGNKTRAAKALGITVKTLYNKLHAYEMV